MAAYDIGDVVRLGNHVTDGASAFKNPAGADTDPTSVTLQVRKPSGALLVYGWPTPGATGSLTKETTGRFYADVAIDASGMWAYRLVGTGAVAAAAEGQIHILLSAFA